VLAPQMAAQPRLLGRLTYALRVGKSLRPLCCLIQVGSGPGGAQGGLCYMRCEQNMPHVCAPPFHGHILRLRG
jgi:hypothetical protein